jgi:DNA-binding transcriptional ArsR family regulator
MVDPFRSRLLFAVADSKDKGVSVRRLAERLKEPPRKIRYHLEVLAGQELVGVAGHGKRRGVVENYYRAEIAPVLDRREEMSPVAWRRQTFNVIRFIFDDVTAALAAQSGERADRFDHHQVRVPGEVDAAGYRELEEIHLRLLGEVEAALAAAETRLDRSGEQSIPVVSVLLLFEAAGQFR